MHITRQADYAVRTILYLAEHEHAPRITTAEIGREQSIPTTFLTKIVGRLVNAGLIHATRGLHGGVTLGRPASEISLLTIVEAIDGPVQLNECVVDAAACQVGGVCAIRQVWCEAQAGLVERLSQTTFAQLAHRPETALIAV